MPKSDIGMAKTTFITLEIEPRNSQQTIPVSTTASPSSSSISLTESSMNCVVSKSTSTVIPGGSVFCTPSMAARIERATATALEPGCFKIPIACTGMPLLRAMLVASAKPSCTRATSPRRTICPFASRTTMLRRVPRSTASPRMRMSSERPPASICPPELVTCCLAMALVMSVTVVFVAISFSESTQMRMLRSLYPMSVTCPTPGSVCSASSIW